MYYVSPQTPAMARARLLFVGALFLVLMALVYGGAYLKVWLDANNGVANPPTFAYDIVIFAIWATVVLLTPALCFHIFSRSTGANTYWRAFWTFAFLAFLV